jgi:SAM-dependent methyltransferase
MSRKFVSSGLAGTAARLAAAMAEPILKVGAALLLPGRAEAVISRLVQWQLDSLAPDDGLRFLFRLDTFLYTLEGRKSVEYEGGIHTKHRHTKYHEYFIDRIHPGEKVLDVGCGVGVLAYRVAAETGASVIGVDLSERNIAEARARWAHPQVEYRTGDVRCGLGGGPFHVVILSNVLEHLDGRADFLRDIVRATQAARLLIRVPLFERDWRVPLRKELGVEWRLDPTHETEYSLESFMEEMTSACLSVSHIELRWGEIWAEVVPA